mmetsp:Transcript_4915/g.16386  ORF Transcript_4915/g.16386 Transcript_4915/m.16386 type:complete len:210 (-) Transcript_4915:255-884(-)
MYVSSFPPVAPTSFSLNFSATRSTNEFAFAISATEPQSTSTSTTQCPNDAASISIDAPSNFSLTRFVVNVAKDVMPRFCIDASSFNKSSSSVFSLLLTSSISSSLLLSLGSSLSTFSISTKHPFGPSTSRNTLRSPPLRLSSPGIGTFISQIASRRRSHTSCAVRSHVSVSKYVSVNVTTASSVPPRPRTRARSKSTPSSAAYLRSTSI